MQYLRLNLRQRLLYGIYAVALVSSLVSYQSVAAPKPLSVAQRHWDAIASANPQLTVTQYSKDAVLIRSYGQLDQIYQGASIYPAWKEFVSKYQIQEFQVVNHKQCHQYVEALIRMTAKSPEGVIVVFSVSNQVQINHKGKIIHEIWQTNPGFSV
jgi:hypothetical protein